MKISFEQLQRWMDSEQRAGALREAERDTEMEGFFDEVGIEPLHDAPGPLASKAQTVAVSLCVCVCLPPSSSLSNNIRPHHISFFRFVHPSSFNRGVRDTTQKIPRERERERVEILKNDR